MAAHQLHKRTHPWCGAHQTGKDDRHVSDLTLPYATPRSILRTRCPTGHRLRARNYPVPRGALSKRKAHARARPAGKRRVTGAWGPLRPALPVSLHHRTIQNGRAPPLPRSEPSLSIPHPSSLRPPPSLPERSRACGLHPRRRLRGAQIRPSRPPPSERACTDVTSNRLPPTSSETASGSLAPAAAVAVRGRAGPIRPNPVEFAVAWCEIG